MQIEIFTLPVYDNREQTEEMNNFLRGHKIIDIEKKFIDSGTSSFWTFMVRYVTGEAFKNEVKKSTKDYKAELEPRVFVIYTELRKIRKIVAEEKNLPLYSLFSNAELSEIAKLDELTNENVIKIKGIGKNKMDNYGKRIIQLYHQYNEKEQNAGNENEQLAF